MNPLYHRDFERIGCWLCPSAPVSELENLSRTHPALYERWMERLRAWAGSEGLERDFIDRGMWRWRDPPPKVRKLAREMGVGLPDEGAGGDLKGMRMPAPANRCGAGGLTVDTRLELPRKASIGRTAQFLRMLGRVKLAEDLGVVTLDADGVRATLHGSGHLVVRGRSVHHLERGYRDVLTAVMQAGYCTSCGVCAERCPRGAIEVGDGVEVDARKCDGCLTCRRGCVVVTYLEKLPAPALRGGRGK